MTSGDKSMYEHWGDLSDFEHVRHIPASSMLEEARSLAEAWRSVEVPW